MMADTLKYIVDESGQKTSVLIPVKMWEDLNANYRNFNKSFLFIIALKMDLLK